MNDEDYLDIEEDNLEDEELTAEELEEEYFPDEVSNDSGYGSYERYRQSQERIRSESESLRQRQDETRMRNLRKQNSDKDDEDDERPESPSSLQKEGIDSENNNKKTSSNDSNDKNDNSGKTNSFNNRVNNIKNKVNTIKEKGNQVAHPIQSTKEKVKGEVQKKVITFVMKWWWVFAIAAVVLLMLLVILLIILGASGEDDENGFLDPTYDFTLTMVTSTNNYTSEDERVNIEWISLEDFIKGAAYLEFRDSLSDKTSSEKKEIYKTFLVAAKSIALGLGGYDASTKEITLKSGDGGMPYCDIDIGCNIINNNGKYTYVTAANRKNIPGTVIGNIGPMDETEKSILNEAYQETKNLLLVPKTVNSVITMYNFERPNYNQTIKNNWLKESSSKYTDIIKKTSDYNNFKLYDMTDYITYFSYAETNSYWWPIGSLAPSSGNIYGGSPSTTNVSSTYGPRTIQGKSSFHYGIDIASSACSSNVIIATRSGTVTTAKGGCATYGSYGNSCNGGYGNYVIIDHGDGTSSVYAHMTKDSIVVREGQAVRQGEKIGLMGSSGSSTGCHLHFEVRVNGSKVDPLKYINTSNPRPTNTIKAGYQSGESNKQSVCLSLLNSGFSKNAVAAIMTNIQAESSFRTDALGDSGTSYGLCQWHNGRNTKLRNFCGSEYSTIKCQLSYLISELQQGYTGVYNYLLSNNSANSMASYYCIYFEVPANRFTNCPNRANNYSASMLSYVENGCK